jgi:hypothetical protein
MLIFWEFFEMLNFSAAQNLKSARVNSNETHTFMCLGRIGRFEQH